MADRRPKAEKLPEFKAEIGKVCKLFDMDITAVLAQGPAVILAKLVFFDTNDEEEMKKLGLAKQNKEEPPSILVN